MTEQTPDIAQGSVAGQHQAKVLQRVGMSRIELPIKLREGNTFPGRASAYVSLDEPMTKGIHMSRLYLILLEQSQSQVFSVSMLHDTLKKFVASHKDISCSAYLEISFELPLDRKALLSEYSGYRSYPLRYRASLNEQGFSCQLSFDLLYSSTCPCSAALSRQLNAQAFQKRFADQTTVHATEVAEWLRSQPGMAATPHGQRSVAEITVIAKESDAELDPAQLIAELEGVLKTPVQTAVKRPDEQEFARLNAQNLMFVEDAARRLAKALDQKPDIGDFRVKVSHLESLHPHDAIAIATKGIAGSSLAPGW